MTGIEKYQQGTDGTRRAKIEEIVQSSQKSIGVRLPQKIMKKNSMGIHAQVRRPIQFANEDLPVAVVVRGLEHFQHASGDQRLGQLMIY